MEKKSELAYYLMRSLQKSRPQNWWAGNPIRRTDYWKSLLPQGILKPGETGGKPSIALLRA